MARKKPSQPAEKPAEEKTKPRKNAAKSAKTVEKPAAKKTAPKPKRKLARGKAHVTRPTVQEEILIYDRRKRVLELKKSGASVRRISALLQSEGHKSASPATVQSDLNFLLDENDTELAMSSLQWRALLVEQMEDQFFRVRTSMFKNETILDENTGEEITVRKEIFDEDKENLLIRNRAFVDKLVGASKAEQSKNAANDALAKLLGCDPEQLGADDSDDDSSHD